MRREFVLVIRGVINDSENDLSESNLRLSLEHAAQQAKDTGLIEGETSAEIEDYDYTVSINDMR